MGVFAGWPLKLEFCKNLKLNNLGYKNVEFKNFEQNHNKSGKLGIAKNLFVQ